MDVGRVRKMSMMIKMLDIRKVANKCFFLQRKEERRIRRRRRRSDQHHIYYKYVYANISIHVIF